MGLIPGAGKRPGKWRMDTKSDMDPKALLQRQIKEQNSKAVTRPAFYNNVFQLRLTGRAFEDIFKRSLLIYATHLNINLACFANRHQTKVSFPSLT